MRHHIGEVREGGPEDVDEAAWVIAAAFQPLPACQWLIPNTPPWFRAMMLRDTFSILVEHALSYGQVDLLSDRHGLAAAAVWFHHDDPRHPVPAPSGYSERLGKATGVYRERFATLDRLFEKNRPHGEPHHHLALLGVTPIRQRLGCGTTLLRHHHERLDAASMPAYLEASSESARDLYLRHGYQLRPPFTLPEGPPFWPMWRPAGPPPE